MLLVDKKGEGWFIHLTLNEFMEFYAKDKTKDLRDYLLIVIGRDIFANDKSLTTYNATQCTSKYDNIEFLPSLTPKAASMEYLGADQTDQFSTLYVNQLMAGEPLKDMLCIVDMVVNDGIKVIMLYLNTERKLGWPPLLFDTFEDLFGIHCYGPVDCIDPEVDTNDYGDIDAIREKINQYKGYLTDSGKKEDFFNEYIDSMEETYREILNRRTVDELVQFAQKKGFWVNRRSTKDAIIDKIIENTYKIG